MFFFYFWQFFASIVQTKLKISLKLSLSFLILNLQCLVNESLCSDRVLWTWKLSSDFYKLPSWCRKCWSYRYLRRAMRECQVCSSSVIEFEARSSKHYFNCGQPVVDDTRPSRYHFFLRPCRTWMEDIARCFYAPRHPIHARWIKVKWDFLFGNCIAIGVRLAQKKKKKEKYQAFSPFFFLLLSKKIFFKVKLIFRINDVTITRET